MRLIDVTMVFTLFTALHAEATMIETVEDIQYFVIDGQKFTAKTFCYEYYDGTYVTFSTGSSDGNCMEAKFSDGSALPCEVWCE
jgi:hypothetical protein